MADEGVHGLAALRERALAEIAAASTVDEVEPLRIRYLGRKQGLIKAELKRIPELPVEARRDFGQAVNQLAVEVEAALDARKSTLAATARPQGPIFDVTLPGLRPLIGSRHPIAQVIDDLVDCFARLGFAKVEGPEVEDPRHNFDALNIPATHPSRDLSDNFFIDHDRLLRSQTSTVQIRVMETTPPPVRVVSPGKVYRPDAVDATHHFLFHQIEGLVVDEGVSLADLKATLGAFARDFFGPGVAIRMRPSFFPFTEPSAEVDISCPFCAGKGCAICKNTGWVEMLGCGMVDPAVFEAVGYDPERWTGFAFGMGVDRIAMFKYQINDIRHFLDNDVRFLKQF